MTTSLDVIKMTIHFTTNTSFTGIIVVQCNTMCRNSSDGVSIPRRSRWNHRLDDRFSDADSLSIHHEGLLLEIPSTSPCTAVCVQSGRILVHNYPSK